MHSFRFDALKICDLLELAEASGKCLGAIGAYFLDLCGSEREIDVLIGALEISFSRVKDVDLLLDSVYSGLLAEAFEKRDAIRKRAA